MCNNIWHQNSESSLDLISLIFTKKSKIIDAYRTLTEVSCFQKRTISGTQQQRPIFPVPSDRKMIDELIYIFSKKKMHTDYRQRFYTKNTLTQLKGWRSFSIEYMFVKSAQYARYNKVVCIQYICEYVWICFELWCR